MIAGDMNITLSSEECWGKCRKYDPLLDQIKFEFLHRNLLDVSPSKMMPTWDNGRLEGASIAKRIDRFIIHISIIDQMGMPISTIKNAFISDHKPISLRWREKGFKYGYPFKFNRTCLEDSAFNEEITKA